MSSEGTVEAPDCTGDCCRMMPLNDSPEQLVEGADESEDGWKLVDMLELVSSERIWNGKVHNRVYYYACRHLTLEGRCDDYENRPAMCKEYPYGEPCDRPNCTSTLGRGRPCDADSANIEEPRAQES